MIEKESSRVRLNFFIGSSCSSWLRSVFFSSSALGTFSKRNLAKARREKERERKLNFASRKYSARIFAKVGSSAFFHHISVDPAACSKFDV